MSVGSDKKVPRNDPNNETKNIIGNKYIACKFDNSCSNVSLSKESLN